jgi:sec-independent protein translocase protein TatC
MAVKQAPTRPPRRSWQVYSHALGRAHEKARLELGTSMPLLQHLEEIRKRMFKAFAALIVTTVLSFVFAGQLIDFLAQPIGGRAALVSIEVTENMAIFMRVSLLAGVVLGMPAVFYQVIGFLLPGLKDTERLYVLIGVPAATLLFASGVAFTWFVMIPAAVPFLIQFLGITTQLRPSSYFEFITALMFWIGLCFEMPLVMAILARLGLITARKLAAGWRYAVVAIALTAAAVTPTVDPVNMGLVMLPLAALYLVSIGLAALVGRR